MTRSFCSLGGAREQSSKKGAAADGPCPCCLAVVTLVWCASPPVTLYTLGQPAVPVEPDLPLGSRATVIEVARVTLPDYLDTQDILVRRGSVLESSHLGRLASRMSHWAPPTCSPHPWHSRRDALATDQPGTGTISYRLLINVSRFDVAADVGAAQGSAALEADWIIVPRNIAIPTLRGRVRLATAGPIGTDQDVVALERTVLGQLAGAIDITLLR